MKIMDATPVEALGEGGKPTERNPLEYTEIKETILEGKRMLEETGEEATMLEVIDALHGFRSEPVTKPNDWMERVAQRAGREFIFGHLVPRLLKAIGVSQEGIEGYLGEYTRGQGRNIQELAEGTRRILRK